MSFSSITNFLIFANEQLSKMKNVLENHKKNIWVVKYLKDIGYFLVIKLQLWSIKSAHDQITKIAYRES